MTEKNEHKALELIEELNRLSIELDHALTMQDHYDDSHNVFWIDEEFSLRKTIKELELRLERLE